MNRNECSAALALLDGVGCCAVPGQDRADGGQRRHCPFKHRAGWNHRRRMRWKVVGRWDQIPALFACCPAWKPSVHFVLRASRGGAGSDCRSCGRRCLRLGVLMCRHPRPTHRHPGAGAREAGPRNPRLARVRPQRSLGSSELPAPENLGSLGQNLFATLQTNYWPPQAGPVLWLCLPGRLCQRSPAERRSKVCRRVAQLPGPGGVERAHDRRKPQVPAWLQRQGTRL